MTPDQTVAALDIGAVGYQSGRRVLDLMGLVSPPVRELGRRQGFEAMVASGTWLRAEPGHPPAFLVDRTDGPPRWSDRVPSRASASSCCAPAGCPAWGCARRSPGPWRSTV